MADAVTALAQPIILAHEFGTAEWTWGILADLLVPVWAVLLLLAPRWGRSTVSSRRFRVVGLAAALLAAVLANVGKAIEIWPGHPLFPSGHTAWALTIAILLVVRDRRWLPWVAALLALLVAALLLAHYHDPVEILGGAGVALLVGAGGVVLLHRPPRGPGSSGAPARPPVDRAST